MSLQVWLPLNGNLNNQGLSDVTVTNNGATIDTTNGKIGKCYYFNGSSYIRISMPSSMTTILDSTIAAWVKSTSSTLALGGISQDLSNYTAPCVTLYSSGWQFTSTARSGYGYVSGGTIANTNIWHHVACTIGIDGTIITYLDGAKVTTSTLTNLNVNTNTNITSDNFIEIGADHPGGNEFLTGYVNDFRIYNHALSPKEVKEISKALVLHYKLDGIGLNNLNLFKGSAMTAADRTGWVSNSSTDWTKYLRYYNGSSSIHSFSEENGVFQDTITLNSASNLGIAFLRAAADIDLDPDSYYTISCEAKTTKSNASLSIGLSYYNNANTWVWRGGTNKKAFTTTNTWQKFTLTFKPDSDTQYICYCFTVVGVASGTDTWTIRYPKLEKGTVATPWQTSFEDDAQRGFISGIEYDNSGYCNNGNIVGILTSVGESPRYKNYYHISATTQKIFVDNLITTGFADSYSFAWWGKCTTWSGKMHWGFADGIRLNGIYNGTLWNTGDGSNNPLYNIGTTTQVTAPDTNWHHWVMTGNGTKCYVYKDGTLWAEAKTYKSISGTTIYINGWNSSISYSLTDLDMSDFRVYATALSAEDVKELYQISASVDNSGNIFTYELEEV